MSPYLFIIYVELLANRVRRCDKIKGLYTGPIENKISQYADDTNFPTYPSRESLNSLLTILSNYAIISGLKPNYDKCKILRVGSIKNTNFTIETSHPVTWADGSVDVLGIHLPGDYSQITTLNFNYRIEKVRKFLQPWKGMGLTVYGKITIIKSLVISQFTYLFMSLPSPNAAFFQKYDNIIFQFLWGGKRNWVKKDDVYKPYDKGGLNLTSLREFNAALKAAWIPRLYCNTKSFCSVYYKTILDQFGGILLFFANLEKKDHNILDPIASVFLKEIIYPWLQYNYTPIDKIDNFLQEIIWNNSNVRINRDPVLWKQFIDVGIIFINDLFDETCSFMKYDEFIVKFGKICTYYKYNQLVSAIPSVWKKAKPNTIKIWVCMPNMRNKIWLTGDKINRDIYTYLLKLNSSDDISLHIKHYWHDILDCHIPWKKVFSLPYRITMDPKLRYFQYKLIRKFLPSNRLLYTWNMIDDHVCTFCKEVTEDYFHLFWDCNFVSKFWSCAVQWYRTITQSSVSINAMKCVLGDVEDHANILFNAFLLMGRYFIYRCKLLGNSINMNCFKLFVKCVYTVEKQSACMNGKQSELAEKWGAFEQFLFMYIVFFSFLLLYNVMYLFVRSFRSCVAYLLLY